MKYLFLSEIGESYHREVGTSGHRSSAFANLETKLKTAIADLRAAKQSKSAGTSFQDRKRFFETKSDPSKIAALEAKVIQRKEWLTRQGGVVDADGNVDWGRSARVVEYDDTLVKQGLTRLHFAGGRVYTDAACSKPFSTRDMVTQFSGPGKAIFVMGRSGNLHVSSHAVGYRHHSSLLSGTNVASAGELEAHNGAITWLSNKSGHYLPSIIHLLQVLHQLQKHNVPLGFPVKVLPDDDTHPTVAAFLAKLELCTENDYEFAKLMQYTFDDALLARNGWRWRSKDSEKPGVYTVATDLPVPHKTVRQWLKTQGTRGATEIKAGANR
jgi:hypothetical protein